MPGVRLAGAEGTSCSLSQAPQVCTHKGSGLSHFPELQPAAEPQRCWLGGLSWSVPSDEHLMSELCPQQREQLEEKRQRARARRQQRPARTGRVGNSASSAPAVLWALPPGGPGFKPQLPDIPLLQFSLL